MTEAPLRRATQQDVDVLFELQKSTALVAYAHIFPEAHAFPDDQVRSEWDAFLRDMGAQVAIAEAEGAPVGTVAVLPPALERLFVIPRYWGAGIGELLHR